MFRCNPSGNWDSSPDSGGCISDGSGSSSGGAGSSAAPIAAGAVAGGVIVIIILVILLRRRKNSDKNWGLPPGDAMFVNGHHTTNLAYNASLIFRKPAVGMDYEVRSTGQRTKHQSKKVEARKSDLP